MTFYCRSIFTGPCFSTHFVSAFMKHSNGTWKHIVCKTVAYSLGALPLIQRPFDRDVALAETVTISPVYTAVRRLPIWGPRHCSSSLLFWRNIGDSETRYTRYIMSPIRRPPVPAPPLFYYLFSRRAPPTLGTLYESIVFITLCYMHYWCHRVGSKCPR